MRYCVIMCGGVGSRFWPASRSNRPKQFLDFMGTGRSLLQMTVDRILPLIPMERIILATNAEYAPMIAQQLPDIKRENILLEPARRNTAPCIAWAAHHVLALDPSASMVVMPSDHLITREHVFLEALEQGFKFVEANPALLTLGIKPSRPETGYGYIQLGNADFDGINHVKTFTEKPNLELAKVFYSTGEFLWNSGIFMWSAKTVLDGLATHCPEIAQRFETAQKDIYCTVEEAQFIEKVFPACPGISIDYALMEKAANAFVKEVDLGWSDLGAWSALYDHSPKNQHSNATQGCAVTSYDTSGCMFFESKADKIIVVDGLKDYIVADTDDVLLVCPMANEQKIKQYVNDVSQTLGEKYL